MPKRILIAEDDKRNAELLKKILLKAGYSIDITYNGLEAFEAAQSKRYDALLTDWMMPKMDGIELIRKVRETVRPVPIILVLTALSSDEAREHALNSGADDFLGKPYDPLELLAMVKNIFSIYDQELPSVAELPSIEVPEIAPYSAVCIAASSGGPQTLREVFKSLPVIKEAVFLIVQHGPDWALKDMARNWSRVSAMDVILGEDEMVIKPGNIYLAPGNRHMLVKHSPVMKIHLSDGPLENYVKPSADPLFRSVARAFGERSIAVVMTGMGCDGALGAGHIAAARGTVIVQDPKTALVFGMPEMTIRAVSSSVIVSLQDIPAMISKYVKMHIKKRLNIN